MDVVRWLGALGLERYAKAFVENDIDETVIGDLNDADLVALGVASVGHRKKILAAIAQEGAQVHVAVASGRSVSRGSLEAPRPAPVSLSDELAARGYVLVDRLGQGGMGDVFIARQTSVAREVAIKMLRVSGEGQANERFAREARAIAALTHPHSVRLFDYLLSHDGNAAIVMEYVRGEPLQALMRREQRIPLERIARIVMQVCDALGEAHAKGIVHRDLKPGNVLLQEASGYRDFAKVLDFGLAHWTTLEESRLTVSGAVCGTPRYLSPEQIQGSEVGPATDLYALGVILYEALAGAAPFGADVEASLMYKHLREAAPPLPSDVERPPALDRILERLLAKTPALRPSSASSLRRELAAILDRAPAEVRSSPSVAPTSSSSKLVTTERRHVAVVDVLLFDDLGERGPEEIHAILRRAYDAVDASGRRHGAFVNARDGAHVQLVLGAPVARRDDERRALLCALDLRSALAAIEGLVPRIGVAVGAGVAGAIDADLGEGYFVSGAALAHAARLCASARPREILVARALSDHVAREFSWDPPSSGDGASLAGTGQSSIDPASGAFVGREAEMDRLLALLTQVQRGGQGLRGRIAVVAGEAGIGKTHLLSHFSRVARQHGMRGALGQVLELGLARSESAISALVLDLLELPPDGDRMAALEARVGLDTLRAEQWPFLYHFLGVPMPGPMQRVYDAMEPTVRQNGYRDMLATLLERESRRAPLLLVLDDLHWADAATLDAIETLAGLTRTLPILLVLGSRVEGEERWRPSLAGHPTARIEIVPLGEAAARQLAAQLGVTEAAHQQAVLARAGGHPLLLIELLRADPESSPSSLPPTIASLVHARLDRLAERDRAAIQVASVLGARATVGELRAVLEDGTYGLRRLSDYRLLRADGDSFVFTHALVRDAVYDALVEERRRDLHLKCASVLASDHARAAVHLERAGSPRAGDAYLEAARREIARHHYDAARELLARGLACTPAPIERALLLERSGEVELTLGNTALALERYREMRELAKSGELFVRACLGEASALRLASRWADALAALEQAEREIDPDALLAGQLAYTRGGVCFAQGRLEECKSAHERALAIAKSHDARELAAQALSGLADAHYGAGRIAAAAQRYAECVALAREDGLLGVEVVNMPLLAMTKAFLGEHRSASELGQRALELARELSRKRAEALARGALAFAALVRGDHDEALEHAEQAREITQQLGAVVYEEVADYYVAQALLGLGRAVEAKAAAEHGAALCRAHGMNFIGSALVATLARLEPDADRRRALLDEADAAAGSEMLAFNRFWWCENGIEAALGDPDRLRRYAGVLAQSGERAPWLALLEERALALADYGEGRRDPATRAWLERVRRAAENADLRAKIPALDEALRAF